jgi:spermidine synthase
MAEKDPADRSPSGGILFFAAAIFLSSFLIFQVQPLIGKYILPWFGGTPGVWSTCLLFFQVALFAGYAYAHGLTRYVGLRSQLVIHLAALAASLFLLPIAPSADWKPTGSEDPTLRILGLLAASVGLPYLLLSANGPLLQAWFSRANPRRSPYGLYSLSNIGSLLGLISYPLLFEQLWPVDEQARTWSWGFAIFALICLLSAIVTGRSGSSAVEATGDSSQRVASASPLIWFALSMCGSVLLLASTNQVCIDVASIPFLWVIPLTLYLLTFILAFADPRWYPRAIAAVLLPLCLIGLCVVLMLAAVARIDAQIAAYFGTMFVGCLVCHGELVRHKPEPARLTLFYLWIAAGGAAGGVFVALMAPQLFSKFIELHLGVFACAALAAWMYVRDPPFSIPGIRPRWMAAAYLVGLAVLGAFLWKAAQGDSSENLAEERNFFGVLRVWDSEGIRYLVHGQIEHGSQVLEGEQRRSPIGYYSPESGAGVALGHPTGPRKIGIVGLGTGSLAVYGQPGDEIQFYEINPDVLTLAQEHFFYLRESGAGDAIRFSMGDARLSMEREPPRDFDCLLVDAFSSDAIPTHLLTAEAFEIYLRHLKPHGILAIHVSNRHFNLEPVVRGGAQRWGLWLKPVNVRRDDARNYNASNWVLLARSATDLESLGLASPEDPSQPDPAKHSQLWTDQHTNLFGVLRPIWQAKK